MNNPNKAFGAHETNSQVLSHYNVVQGWLISFATKDEST
jgi:hypothetical protein